MELRRLGFKEYEKILSEKDMIKSARKCQQFDSQARDHDNSALSE